jgi:hypothetical protein
MNITPPSRPHSAEFELLFLCARTTVDSAAQQRITALVHSGLDWDFLIVVAHQHCVLPLLYRNLSRHRATIPDLAMERLQFAFNNNAKRNLFLTRELIHVIELLGANQIDCIPYKGPVLAALIYGDLSFRQFGDLDVIVRVEDVPRATELLVARGYRQSKVVTDERLRTRAETAKDVTLYRDDIGVELEVHWAVTSEWHPVNVSASLLWKGLTPRSIAGKSFLTPAFEDLLLIQCIHGATHAWERLGWVCDVAEIVRSQPDLDWKRVVKNASAVGGKRIVFQGLVLARDLLGAELPPDIVKMIDGDPASVPLSAEVKRWLVGEPHVPLDLGERERYFMRLQERPAGKIRVAVHQAKKFLALTARDTESFPLPGFLTFVLYVLRPIRLACAYGFAPFKRFVSGLFQA